VLGIVHRDLKPENLFLTRQPDGSPCLKILDFGISKQLGGRSDRSITGPFGVMGSPRYMAPEQLLAEHVDQRADIWALGAILYELLTGVPAFDAGSLPALCAQVLGEPPAPPRDFAPRVPGGLDAAVLRCLRRDREQRFRHVGELALAIAPYGSEIGRRAGERIRALLMPPAALEPVDERQDGHAAPIEHARTRRMLLRPLSPEGRRHVLALAMTLTVVALLFSVIARREPARAAAAQPRIAQLHVPAPEATATAASGQTDAPICESRVRADDVLPALAAPMKPEGPAGSSAALAPLAAPLAKHKQSLADAPSDGGDAAANAEAPPVWTPRQAWDTRNFGSRQ
jgi:serine/threonine-protein kinase